MENASKALLIAGAILLSILIIGVGIAVFSNTKGNIDESLESMNEQQVTAFNSKFTSYQGEEKSGTDVKTLLDTLAANYATYEDEKEKVPTVETKDLKNSKGTAVSGITNATYGTSYNTNISKIRNEVVSKHTYKITMEFANTGLINKITIEDMTGK